MSEWEGGDRKASALWFLKTMWEEKKKENLTSTLRDNLQQIYWMTCECTKVFFFFFFFCLLEFNPFTLISCSNHCFLSSSVSLGCDVKIKLRDWEDSRTHEPAPSRAWLNVNFQSRQLLATPAASHHRHHHHHHHETVAQRHTRRSHCVFKANFELFHLLGRYQT